MRVDLQILFRAFARFMGSKLAILAVAAVAAALCGFVAHRNGLFVCGAVLLVLAIGVAWPWICIKQIRASLEFTIDRGRIGETVEGRLLIRNRALWPAWGLAVGLADADNRIAFPAIGARGSARASYVCVLSERGWFPANLPRVICSFPFGLWRAARMVDLPSPILVRLGKLVVGELRSARRPRSQRRSLAR